MQWVSKPWVAKKKSSIIWIDTWLDTTIYFSSQHNILDFQPTINWGSNASNHFKKNNEVHANLPRFILKACSIHISHVPIRLREAYASANQLNIDLINRSSKRIIRSEAYYGLQQWLAHLSPSWSSSTTTSLSQHLPKLGFSTWYKSTIMWKTSWVYLVDKPMTTQPHQKQHMAGHQCPT